MDDERYRGTLRREMIGDKDNDEAGDEEGERRPGREEWR